MPSLRNGWCIFCRGQIRAVAQNGETTVTCPHCGGEMTASAAVAYRRRFRRTQRWVWIMAAVIFAAGLGALGYVFRTPLRWGFDLLVEETGSITAALVSLGIGVVVLLWLVLWMLFPIVVYMGLRELRRRTSELEETTMLCARHLAELTRHRGERQNGRGGPSLPTALSRGADTRLSTESGASNPALGESAPMPRDPAAGSS